MKSCGWIIVGWGLLLAAGYGAESDGLDPIRDIYLTCRHPGGPMSDDDLLGYAKSRGFPMPKWPRNWWHWPKWG